MPVSETQEMAHWLERDGANCQRHIDCAQEMRRLEAEVEQLRVQLAGCGVAAMQNTEASKEQRAKPGDYGWSSSYGEVCAAVDREIALREANAELLEALKSASNYIDTLGGVSQSYRQLIQKHGGGA